ncbi:hypothetical protein ANN_11292 [Periplaneta americana]|uniref:Uncharacterized protein n=1 Tax=Periplaneta americana TaxID=6978 RepID=A0ABQ8T6B3_PERAM|nr:hypothetical protein ANN_11292 [Periplaneta americana]
MTYCSAYLASSVLVIIDAITSFAVNDDIFSTHVTAATVRDDSPLPREEFHHPRQKTKEP